MAPVGSPDSLSAALRAGADSVYFGDSKRDGDGGNPKGEPTYDPTGGFSQLADDDSELPF